MKNFSTERSMQDLFTTPIITRKVRDGVYAYKYRNGTINIYGTKFIFFSMADAIRKWRKDNKL